MNTIYHMPGFLGSDTQAGLSEVILLFHMVLTGLPQWCLAGGWSVLGGGRGRGSKTFSFIGLEP